MKIHYSLVVIIILLFSSCLSNRWLVEDSPFVLGTVYTQRWIAEDNLQNEGYSVIIPIVSLSNEQAVLQNLYHKGKIIPLKIKLKDIGVVAIAKFPIEDDKNKKDINKVYKADVSVKIQQQMHQLSDDELVISYLSEDKIKYFKLRNVRHNPLKSYPTAVLADFD